MSSITIYCPACGSTKIVTTRDIIRNLVIIGCESCDEMYAINTNDLYELGIEQVIREWYISYFKSLRIKRLEA